MTLGGPPLIALPEPIGRRARLGPFPTGRDALKFAAVAGFGAAIADATTPIVWIPFLGAGLLLGIARWDGQPLDAHAAGYLRFRTRRRAPDGGRRPGRPGNPPGGVVRLPGGRTVAVLEAGGVPVAFLPRREAEALFDGFRALLRADAEGLYLCVDGRAVVRDAPPSGDPPGADPRVGPARDGYRELLTLVLRSRRRRIVRVVAWSEPGSPDALARLEARVGVLLGGLLALGVPVVRLEGDPLAGALREIGWEVD